MISGIGKWLGAKEAPEANCARKDDEAHDSLTLLSRYPPVDEGLPVIPPAKLIEAQSDLIGRIERTLGFSKENYQRLVLPVVMRLAEYAHLLPATADAHHKGPGGLFRLSLQIALYALQGANAAVFPIAGGVERRYQVQPKWILSTMLAGMCSQLYRILTTMIVVADDGEQWKPLLGSLHEWAASKGYPRYYVRWQGSSDPDRPRDTETANVTQGASAFLLARVVPPDVLQWIADGNNEVMSALTDAITGTAGMSGNPIARIVAPVASRIITQDLKQSPENYGRLSVGYLLEPHLIDAMRRLIRNGTWRCNQPNGVLWVGADGAFLDWIPAAAQIVELLNQDRFAGVPRDPETLAATLVNAGVFLANLSDTVRRKYWTIIRPMSMEPLDGAVRLATPTLILGENFDQEPYGDVRLLLPSDGSGNRHCGESSTTVPVAPPEARDIPGPSGDDGIEAEANGSGETARQIQEQTSTTVETLPTVENPDKAIVVLDEAPRQANRAEQSILPDQGATAKRQKESRRSAGTDNEGAAERLLAALKPENAWLMKEILKRAARGDVAGPVVALPQGVGIAHEELDAHNQPITEFIADLNKHGWLWLDVVRPSRKMHAVDHDGRRWRMLILRQDIATALGFDAQVRDIELSRAEPTGEAL